MHDKDGSLKAAIAIINALLQHDIDANTQFCGPHLADDRYNAVEALSMILYDVIPAIDYIEVKGGYIYPMTGTQIIEPKD